LLRLPEEVGQARQLVHLLLQNNELCELPDTIGRLPALSNLNLAHNRLTTLPAAIALLPLIEVRNAPRQCVRSSAEALFPSLPHR
jgi:Leucine-rich repeat (LRR) protein